MKRISCSLVWMLAITVFCSAQNTLPSTAAPGFAVTDFATGFVNLGGIGPIGLAFDTSGSLFVGNYTTGFLYKFGPTGGAASAATQVNAVVIGGHPAGLAFSKDGRLYLARQVSLDGGDVVELDPADGTILRKVAVIAGSTGLATDPVSGDLFVSTGGIGPSVIWRVSNFASGPGTVTAYSPHAADGLAFGPDGTLFAASGGVLEIQGTGAPTPGAAISFVPVPSIDGMAVSADPLTPFVFANRQDGIITKVDGSTHPPTVTNIFTGGTRGDFATVGFDGCLYATQTDRVIKVTNADGTCVPPPLGPLFPTSPTSIRVAVDIKPGGCPNPFNVEAPGVLPVAILGSAGFDVSTVDASSVKLQDVPALRSALEDVATPFIGPLVSANSCTTSGPDGFIDLVLHFDDQAIAAALGPVSDGQVRILTLTGNLLPQFGGTPIRGQDVIVIIDN